MEITESLLVEGAGHKRKNTVALGSIEEEAGGSGKRRRSMEVAHPITLTMAAAGSSPADPNDHHELELQGA